MGGSGEVTVWTAGDAKAIPAALRALREHYRVVTGRPVDVHRLWLDTADWRLHRAGLALAAVSTGPASSGQPDHPGKVQELAGSELTGLELTGADDAPALVTPDVPGAPGWPRLLGGLPPEVQSRLAGVLGVRALLPVADVHGGVATGALLDEEGKTVVRLERHKAAGVAGVPGRVPARLTLVPVRGYRADAARAARVVRAAGLTRAECSGYRTALAVAGYDPDAVPPPAMLPHLPASVAVARVLLTFLTEMETTLDGTIADIDTEFLHDFRVAVRRSRSAVKLLGDALPAELVAWAAPQLKWLGDLTTPMRDLDVHLLGLPDAGARLRGTRPEDLQPLADYLLRIRAGERRTLTRGLRSARYRRFRERWRTGLEEIAGPPEPDGDATAGRGAAEPTAVAPTAGEPTAAELGAVRLARAHRRVLRPGSRITADSPAEDLHDLRKRGKELRYLLEIFSCLLHDDARRLVKELKGLQDVLGTFQDSEVQREAVVRLAESMLADGRAPAGTLLAMGELAGRLHDDQVAAREEFGRRFERFAAASPSGGLTQ